MGEPADLLTVKAAAALLGCSELMLYQHLHQGRLASVVETSETTTGTP